MNELRNQIEPEFKVRGETCFDENAPELVIRICMGSSCSGSGAVQVRNEFEKLITNYHPNGSIKLLSSIRTGCHGLCEMGPIVIVNPGNVLHTRVTPEDVPEIFERHLFNGEIVERLAYHDPVKGNTVPFYHDITFYKNQTRKVLEKNGFINPWEIKEYIGLGGYAAIGKVKQGYAYIRAEYPLAIEILTNAINQAKELGLLGTNILNTGMDFDIEILPGAGAFVCGEETAFSLSIEGKKGQPRQRPPFPANAGGGLFGKPTTINNVETWSNVPQIILYGEDNFARLGTEKATGTNTFSLVGKINNTGLVEVPLGTSIGKMIFDIGGGIPDGKKFKAVQIGGPSGGVIPASHLNTPVDYESITALGAIVGSGGLVVLDEDSCMVDVARYFLDFTRNESCGKCVACREGIPQMLKILYRISNGNATLKDIDLLESLGKIIKASALCGLGQTAPNPVTSTIRHFRKEYEQHIVEKKSVLQPCAAGCSPRHASIAARWESIFPDISA